MNGTIENSPEFRDYLQRRATVQETIEKRQLKNVQDFTVLSPEKLKKNKFSRVIIQARDETTIEIIKGLFKKDDISETFINPHRSFSLSLTGIIPSKSPLHASSLKPNSGSGQKSTDLSNQLLANEALDVIGRLHDARGIIGVLDRNSIKLSEASAVFLYFSPTETDNARDFFSQLGFNAQSIESSRLKFNLSLPKGFDSDQILEKPGFLKRADAKTILSDSQVALKLVSWELVHRFSAAVKIEGVVSTVNPSKSTRFSTNHLPPSKLADGLRCIEKMYGIQAAIDQQEPKTFFVMLPVVQNIPESSESEKQNQQHQSEKITAKTKASMSQKPNGLKKDLESFFRKNGYGSSDYSTYPLNKNQTVTINCVTRKAAEKILASLKQQEFIASLEDGKKAIHVSPPSPSLKTSPVSVDKKTTVLLNQTIYNALGDSFVSYPSRVNRDPGKVYIKLEKLSKQEYTKVLFVGGSNRDARQEKSTAAAMLLKKAGLKIVVMETTIRVFPKDEVKVKTASRSTNLTKSDNFHEQFMDLLTPEGRKIFGDGGGAEKLVQKISEKFMFISKQSPFMGLLNEKAFSTPEDVLEEIK